MRSISSAHIRSFQQKILTWYEVHRRDFPWRHTQDPYRILVSEVMSQQTQIQRVVQKYDHWLHAFPDVLTLSLATPRQVLSLWSGLGYNRRALYLHACAKEIVSRYAGNFPRTKKELMTLPGIGDYTASAILAFAFDQDVATIDTNVRKVLSVEFFDNESPGEKDMRDVAERVLVKGKARIWNQALMDYAAISLKDTRIRIPKQPPFKGSNRYYRGQILKQLAQKEVLTNNEIDVLFSGDMPAERKQDILTSLLRDGLVVQDEQGITFPG